MPRHAECAPARVRLAGCHRRSVLQTTRQRAQRMAASRTRSGAIMRTAVASSVMTRLMAKKTILNTVERSKIIPRHSQARLTPHPTLGAEATRPSLTR